MPLYNGSTLERVLLNTPLKAFNMHSTTAARKGLLFGSSEGAPTDTDTGWAPGAIVIDNENAIVYRNSGDSTSATWTAISALRPQELKGITWPAANGTFAFGVPFVIVTKVENKNGWTNTPVMPCKCRIIKAWSVNQSANGGQWKLGTAGGAADICALQTVAASDTDVDYVTDLDDAHTAVASGVAIAVYSDATLDAEIFVMCIPEA